MEEAHEAKTCSMCALCTHAKIGTNLNSQNSKCCYSYGTLDYWVAWRHDLPASTFKDDKLLGLLRVQSQIIRSCPVRHVIKLMMMMMMIMMVLCPKAGSLTFMPPGDEKSEVVSRC